MMQNKPHDLTFENLLEACMLRPCLPILPLIAPQGVLNRRVMFSSSHMTWENLPAMPLACIGLLRCLPTLLEGVHVVTSETTWQATVSKWYCNLYCHLGCVTFLEFLWGQKNDSPPLPPNPPRPPPLSPPRPKPRGGRMSQFAGAPAAPSQP